MIGDQHFLPHYLPYIISVIFRDDHHWVLQNSQTPFCSFVSFFTFSWKGRILERGFLCKYHKFWGWDFGIMESGDERINVSVRLRPLNGKEILRNDVSDWECINDKTIVFKNVSLSASERSMYPTAYSFDRVFRSDSSTREVYEQAAKDVAISVLSGMNSSVFAYGQTSSGKTFTMTGITEYAITDIYEYIQKHPERAFVLKFSAMEIYNESVRDLLSVDSTPLRLLDDPERGTIVEKLTEETLKDWNHVVQLLSVCEAQRQIGETSLNEMSSRSHQIIRLTTESSSREFLGRDNASTLTASVNFVDLAGSERASQSLTAGTRLKEGCHINRSLLTLGTVIRKLSKGRGRHIPFRDSKLTRILQTSLGGNARTAIICTMSPARSHVEQSRNTLLFASCAKEVTTNAKVNVVMSDKALVKYLQRELARLESELRSPQSSTVSPTNYSAVLREKDLQIEKLLEEINDLILQRDIAQSQVKDLLQMLGDAYCSCSCSTKRVETEQLQYPSLRVQRSPDSVTRTQEPSILGDHHSLNVDSRSCSEGLSRESSVGQIVKVPYFEDDFAHSTNETSPMMLNSNYSESYSYNSWEEMEKRSNAASEDLCREVRCIKTSNKMDTESNSVCSEDDNSKFPDAQTPSTPFENDRVFNETEDDKGTSKENQEVVTAPLRVVKESMPKREREVGSIRFLETPSPGNMSSTYDQEKDDSDTRLKFMKSRSCKASIAGSGSPWFKTDYSEITSFFGTERESVGCEKKMSPSSFTPKEQHLSRKDSQSSPENAFDIEIDIPNVKFPTAESKATEIKKDELPNEDMYIEDQPKVVEVKVHESQKRDVKDVGLDPISDESRSPSNWPMEFKMLQNEIIQFWHDCNVSLVHRTYFFMLFQGDPSDAIYLEVEIRRMKFLKDKFSRGEKTIVNGRSLTLASSEKALREERRMLSQKMGKKLSEQERETLFLKWGIGLNSKLRRLQLAQRLWTKTDDIDHISDSALLIAKLVASTEERAHSHNKEMFGLNFTPRRPTRMNSFRRTLIPFL